MSARMNSQARDIVNAMVEANSIPECCNLCGETLEENAYSLFATVCKSCVDAVEESQ